jgi:prepilin-type N-terminal cleavage/methylation domain-containing protein
MQLKKQTGFTLVEIAIVLVIVGLLIGGVLKGQEMITNAKLKRIESDNAGMAAAMFSYQDRYLQLPGDDGDATTRFNVYFDLAANGGQGWVAGEADGDGDGVIGDGNDWKTVKQGAAGWNSGDTTEETSKFFGHLRAAGLIPGGSGIDASRPTSAYGGLIGIQNGSLGIAGHAVIFGQIEGAIGRILEARLDDGNADTGRIQSNNSATDDMDSGTAPGTATYDDDTRYDMAFRL